MQRQAFKYGLIVETDTSACVVDAAVNTAASAFPFWSRMPVADRVIILQDMMVALDAHREELNEFTELRWIATHQTGHTPTLWN